MNRVKFALYNLINPKENEIPEIAEYIIKNNITNLPSNLTSSNELFIYLLKNNYSNLFSLNFKSWKDMHNSPDNLNDIVKYIIDNNIPCSKFITFGFDEDILMQIIDNLLDKGMVYLLISELSINKELYNRINKNKLIKKMPIYNISFDEIPFIKEDEDYLREMLNKNMPNLFEIGFSEELYQKIGLYRLFEYISKNNITNLPNFIVKDKETLKKLIRSLSTNYQNYSLQNIIIRNLIKESNPEIMEFIYEMYVNHEIFFEEDTYLLLNKEALAENIIKNNISSIPNLIRIDEQVFNILLDRKYEYIFSLSFKFEFYENNKLKLLDMLLENPSKSFLNANLYVDILFNSSELINPEYIPKVGEFLINNPNVILLSRWPIASSVELFNYLLEKDVSNLFKLNFKEEVYEKIPLAKLNQYYKQHNEELPANIPSILKLKIKMGYAIDKVELQSIIPILLYNERKKAEDSMLKYNNLSLRICNSLKVKTPEETYLEFSEELIQLWKTKGIDMAEILQLFQNYKENPTKYEEVIIKLIQEFCSKRKEEIAKENLNIVLNYIENNYTVMDMEEYHNELKKQKRKYLYLEHIKTILTSEPSSKEIIAILSLYNELNIKESNISLYELIAKIINGEEVITIPNSYKKAEQIKVLNRLRKNYSVSLSKIIIANKEYSKDIIDYINSKLSYDELKSKLDPKVMKQLHEICELCKEAAAFIELNDGKIIFNSTLELSTEEISQNEIYEKNNAIIKKLRKLLNKDMYEAYPLDNIDISKEEELIYDKKTIKHKKYIDFSTQEKAVYYIALFMKIRDSYTDKHYKQIFDKLFIDSNIIYGLAFINHDNERELANGRRETDTIKNLEAVARHIDIVAKNFKEEEITFDNIEKIIRKVGLLLYTNASDIAILGEDTAIKIAYNDTFIITPDDIHEGRRKRIAAATKYSSLATGSVKSTIPFIKSKSNGVVIERYNPGDADILLAGINTDACFRVFGNDNDFLLYTMFSKDGIVIKITDESGKFIGRISGFRNGNTLYFNQLRTIYDSHDNPNALINKHIEELRRSVEKYAREIIDATRNTDNPIENVLIIGAYGYANCGYLPVVSREIVPTFPMNSTSEDFQKFKSNPELKLFDGARGFTTDYYGFSPILLLASADDKKEVKATDIKSGDSKTTYDRPRKEVIKLNISHSDRYSTSYVINHINKINAKFIYWGDQETRKQKMDNFKPVTSIDNIIYAIIGEDFYILVDTEGNITELCLPYDKRAKEEFEKYRSIVISTYQNNNHKTK